jgi:hypothetical protein
MKLSTLNFLACIFHAINLLAAISTGSMHSIIGWALVLLYCSAYAIELKELGN